MGWHRAKHRKHPTVNLWHSWTHDSGAEIWQGRPFRNDPSNFLYRLVQGETNRDFHLLNEAKRAVKDRT